MIKKNLSILAIVCSVILLLTGCNLNGGERVHADKDTLQVTHKLGTTTVNFIPKKVVALDVGALETLYELGIKPAAICKKNLPKYLKILEKNNSIQDAGSIKEPDLEAIAAVAPDLILISARQERFYEELKAIAPTIYVGIDPKDYLASFIKNTKLIGQIFDKEDLVNTKLDSIQHKIAAEQKRFAADSNKALFLLFNNGKFSAYGKGSRFGFIHDVLHIKPVLDLEGESVHGQRISNELIAESNPDYLFIVDRNAAVMGKPANKDDVENTLVKQTKAYKNGKIFYMNPEVWYISGGGLLSFSKMLEDINTQVN